MERDVDMGKSDGEGGGKGLLEGKGWRGMWIWKRVMGKGGERGYLWEFDKGC